MSGSKATTNGMTRKTMTDGKSEENYDGSEPLPDAPVIISFAFSVEEWAMLSAALLNTKENAQHVARVTGKDMPIEVEGVVRASAQMARIIADEMAKADW